MYTPKAFAAAKPVRRIGYAGTLGLKNIKGVTAFKIGYGRQHTYPISSGRFPNSSTANLYHLVSDIKYKARKDPLWLGCTARTGGVYGKSIIRNWVVRRVKHAMAESFKKEGFTMNGERLDKRAEGEILYGSVHIAIEPAALTMPYIDVVRQTDITVQVLIEALAKAGTGEETPDEKVPGNT